MAYGAMLNTTSGHVWVTPQSTPISLKSRKVVELQGVQGFHTTVTETFDSGEPMIAFVHTTIGVRISQKISGNSIIVDFLWPDNYGVATVYFFTIFQQVAPRYGLAVWDENGKLVLTNETKTLTDVIRIGNQGDPGTSGYNANALIGGRYACVPSMQGLITGVIGSGQPRPYSAVYFSIALQEGGATRIRARPETQPGGGLTNINYHNMVNQIVAIETSKYD